MDHTPISSDNLTDVLEHPFTRRSTPLLRVLLYLLLVLLVTETCVILSRGGTDFALEGVVSIFRLFIFLGLFMIGVYAGLSIHHRVNDS